MTPIRMPNGVMDWLENGHTVTSHAETIAAEAASQQGDPRSYEQALEWQRTRPPATRRTGKPMFTMITDAMGLTGPDAKAEVTNPGGPVCGHPNGKCQCPTPDPTSRLNAGGGWDMPRISEREN